MNDAANLSRAQLELAGDRFEPRVVADRTVLEALDDELRDPLRIVDGRIAGGQLGPAAQPVLDRKSVV